VRNQTLESRRRLYLQARVVVARHYGRRLTLPVVARALASSPRELQRAYAQFGELTFREDLQERRLRAGAELLGTQPSIPVSAVARLVGYSQAPHFGRVFGERYGLSPGRFRERARLGLAQSPASPTGAKEVSDACSSGERSPAASAPGRRSRISVPPPAGASAVTAPPC
jgi:AraC family transcriptional regulator of adaptative response / methylphosphotriester-DNA alkyltransferase methyltransferase